MTQLAARASLRLLLDFDRLPNRGLLRFFLFGVSCSSRALLFLLCGVAGFLFGGVAGRGATHRAFGFSGGNVKLRTFAFFCFVMLSNGCFTQTVSRDTGSLALHPQIAFISSACWLFQNPAPLRALFILTTSFLLCSRIL